MSSNNNLQDMKFILKFYFTVLIVIFSIYTDTLLTGLTKKALAQNNKPQEVLQAQTPQWTFMETFNGLPTTPAQNILPSTLDYIVTHRTVPATPDGLDVTGSYGDFVADHGMACSGPPDQHAVSTTHRGTGANPDQTFFICNDHMMSSMGDVEGYSIATFYPKKVFDFSNGATISFDVNINENHPRSWWEILITPREQMKVGAAQEYFPIDETYPKDRVVLTFDPNSTRAIEVGKSYVPPNGWQTQEKDWRKWSDVAPNDPAITDRKIRRNMTIEITSSKIIWKITKADGTYDSFSANLPAGLPFSKGVIMFKTHAYTPEKDGNTNLYTYHWDNLYIDAPIYSEWDSFESSKVVNLETNGNKPIGSSDNQIINLPLVSTNPILSGQIHYGKVGQILLSINDSPNISITPIDQSCAYEGWASFSVPIDPTALKTGDNVLKWTVGPRPACTPGWMWDGFAAKGVEIQFDKTGIPVTPPPIPPTETDVTPPVISNALPAGILNPGTTSTTLSVITNETASCRYNINVDLGYELMTSTMASANGLAHTQQVIGLIDGNTYVYYVRCEDKSSNLNKNLTGTKIEFSVAQPSTPPPPPITPPPQASNIFKTTYYDGINFEELKMSNIYTTNINYNWGMGSPYAKQLGNNDYSIRWEGDFDFVGGNYDFQTTYDEGVKLFIDDIVIYEDWKNGKIRTGKVSMPISQGIHKVRLEYYENRGNALVDLSWILKN